jgi:hypothetical protein
VQPLRAKIICTTARRNPGGCHDWLDQTIFNLSASIRTGRARAALSPSTQKTLSRKEGNTQRSDASFGLRRRRGKHNLGNIFRQLNVAINPSQCGRMNQVDIRQLRVICAPKAAFPSRCFEISSPHKNDFNLSSLAVDGDWLNEVDGEASLARTFEDSPNIVFPFLNHLVNLLPDGNHFLPLNGTNLACSLVIMSNRRQCVNSLVEQGFDKLAFS